MHAFCRMVQRAGTQAGGNDRRQRAAAGTSPGILDGRSRIAIVIAVPARSLAAALREALCSARAPPALNPRGSSCRAAHTAASDWQRYCEAELLTSLAVRTPCSPPTMAPALLALLLPLLLACQAGGELLMVYSVQRHGARCAGGCSAACRRCRRRLPLACDSAGIWLSVAHRPG